MRNPRVRSVRTISMPSRPGSIQSRTTASKRSVLRSDSPLSPEDAATASCPSPRSPAQIAVAVFASSSMMRTLAMDNARSALAISMRLRLQCADQFVDVLFESTMSGAVVDPRGRYVVPVLDGHGRRRCERREVDADRHDARCVRQVSARYTRGPESLHVEPLSTEGLCDG